MHASEFERSPERGIDIQSGLLIFLNDYESSVWPSKDLHLSAEGYPHLGVCDNMSYVLHTHTDVCGNKKDENVYTRALFDKQNRTHTHRYMWVFTEGQVLSVPLPDQTMPFNVIALTCTVVGIVFASIFRLTVNTHAENAHTDKRTLIRKFLDKFLRKKATFESEKKQQ